METLTIEIRNLHALGLIKEMEALNFIRVVKKQARRTVKSNLSLAEKMWNSVTHEQAEEMRKELVEMKNEWERGI